jgi:hypothetical protein
VYKSKGTKVKSVQELNTKNVYWMPSIPNFPNIDAAVVIGDVLYAFQYTILSNHTFKKDTFWRDFVHVVRGQVEFARVHVYIVSPNNVSSLCAVKDTWQWTASSGTRTAAVRINISCTSSTLNIDTKSVHTIRSTAEQGFLFDK